MSDERWIKVSREQRDAIDGIGRVEALDGVRAPAAISAIVTAYDNSDWIPPGHRLAVVEEGFARSLVAAADAIREVPA